MQINASGLRTSIVSFMARSVWCLSPLLEWHMHWTWSDATYTFIAHIKSINPHALISNNQMRMSPNIYTGKWLFRTTAGCHFSSQFVRRRESSAVLNQNSNIYISDSRPQWNTPSNIGVQPQQMFILLCDGSLPCGPPNRKNSILLTHIHSISNRSPINRSNMRHMHDKVNITDFAKKSKSHIFINMSHHHFYIMDDASTQLYNFLYSAIAFSIFFLAQTPCAINHSIVFLYYVWVIVCFRTVWANASPSSIVFRRDAHQQTPTIYNSKLCMYNDSKWRKNLSNSFCSPSTLSCARFIFLDFILVCLLPSRKSDGDEQENKSSIHFIMLDEKQLSIVQVWHKKRCHYYCLLS